MEALCCPAEFFLQTTCRSSLLDPEDHNMNFDNPIYFISVAIYLMEISASQIV
jgi:hypothetical protein